MKLYGNLTNRLEENQNYTNKPLAVGTDITMYYWSDRTCYYITRVLNQKHIFVKKYEVCADQDKEGGMGHQNWKYFKTVAEYNTYLKAHNLSAHEVAYENPEQEWAYRYNHWYQILRYNLNTWNKCLENAKKDVKPGRDPQSLARLYLRLNDEEFNKVLSGKEIIKYQKLQPISFGIRDYYYDWEF